MSTSLATVKSDWDAAITALTLVQTDLYDPTTGYIADETAAAALTSAERLQAAQAGTAVRRALAAMKNSRLKPQVT